MAYDPESDGTTATGSSSSSSAGGSSTGGRGFSYSNPGGDRRADSLDPVRKAEAGSRWNPNNSSTGSRSGGASDSTAASGDGASTPTSGKGAPEPGSGLRDREENPDDTVGQGYSDDSSSQTGKRRGRFRGAFTRRRVAIGTGALVGVGGTGAVVFFMLIPLKIETAVKDLESKAMSVVQSDVQQENRTLFEKYIVSRVLPGYQRCGSTRDRHCSAIKFSNGNNPVTGLYNAWAQSRFETRLADDYGIEFRYHPKSGTWVVLAPGLGTNGEDIGQAGNNLDNVFSSRTAARKAIGDVVDDALAGESRWKAAFTRYKLGRLLEEKYGLPRCVVICKVTDPLHDFVNDQKKAATLYLTQRVIIPRTQTLGIALECLMTNCDPTKTQPNGDPGSPATGGEPADPEVEKPVSDGMKALAAKYEIDDPAALKDLQDTFDKINEKGLQKWLVSEGLQKLGTGPAVADITADAIPIAGQVNFVAQTVNAADNSSTSLKKLRYVVNSTADVNMIMTFKTFASEMHNGNASATEVGSMVKALGSADALDSKAAGAAAEAAPIWQRVVEGKSTISRSAGTAKNYTCNDGKNVSSTSLICPEASLGGGNSYANMLHSILNSPPFLPFTTIAKGWTDTFGQVYNFFGGIFGTAFSAAMKVAEAPCSVPGLKTVNPFCQAEDLAKKESANIIEAITKWLIPNPLEKMDGAHVVTAMAGGAAVEAHDAGTMIGGHDMTDQQVAAIAGQAEQDQRQQFAHQSFFARMFSTASPYSLLSRVAMATPFDFQSSAQNGFATLFSNPLGLLGHSFGSIFSKVSADTSGSDASDLFGAYSVTPEGWTPQEIAAIGGGDQESYDQTSCNSDESQGFQNGNTYNITASQHTDPNTGMPSYPVGNPCKLIQASVCSLGATMDTSLCAPDDVADVNGSSGTSTGGVGGLTNPFPDGWTPGRLDMGYDGHFTNKIVSPCDGNMLYSYPDAAHDDNGGWKGAYFVVQCSQPLSGMPAGANGFYFAEGVSPTVAQGQPVTAGQQIGVPGWTGYSEGPGGIEWGLANVSNPRETWAAHLGNSCAAGSPAQQFVLSFNDWVQQNLGVAKTSDTGHAGCA